MDYQISIEAHPQFAILNLISSFCPVSAAKTIKINSFYFSCDGRPSCVVTENCENSQVFLKTIFACVQSELFIGDMFVEVNDVESDALGKNMTNRDIENKLALEQDEAARTDANIETESNGAISANDSSQVTRDTNNVLEDTGRPAADNTGRN